MKVAVIGQSPFGAEVFKEIKSRGHEVVCVFTPPDTNGKEDVLAQEARKAGVKVTKFDKWMVKGVIIPEVFEEYKTCGAAVNVLAFVTQFIPMEVINYPVHASICFHPSILPRHRGASAINWTLMDGDAEAGWTIFWCDDGLDTGPICLQEKTAVLPDDTLSSLYSRFIFPTGVQGMARAVDLIQAGTAPRIVQPAEGATYDKIWKKKDLAKVDFSQPAAKVHNFIRGNDKVPGAWTMLNGLQVTLFGSSLLPPTMALPAGTGAVPVEGAAAVALGAHLEGAVFTCGDGGKVLVRKFQLPDKRTINANDFLTASAGAAAGGGAAAGFNPTPAEAEWESKARSVWAAILGCNVVEPLTDFFGAGASSMDVVRLVEMLGGGLVTPELAYENTTFGAFVRACCLSARAVAAGGAAAPSYKTVAISAGGRELRLPTQLFINGNFCDAKDGQTRPSINPSTTLPICEVAQAGAEDVKLAVAAAKAAFEHPAWRRLNPRERGRLLWRLADLMEEHKDELATIEAIDSGAVYTTALKTHVGMSIETFRYFSGWCDKIQGSTIPINQARPNFNLCFTKREPIGVCALVVPWNYPLMMLAWKMAPCLAAGNTVIIKPANVTPLSALKWAELVNKAGFPPGVVNVLPGAGLLVGDCLARHPDVRKVGFTGSTGVGQTIMKTAAESNLKKVSLELGGKSPLILFEDCDLERAIKGALSAAFFNKGENCIAAGRVFVARAILTKFLEGVVAGVSRMKIGDPLDLTTDHGPQNHEAHLRKLLAYVQSAVKEGAKLVYGGTRVEGLAGYYMHPAILTDVTDNMACAKEESFGPVMVVMPFEGSVEEAIRRSNDCEFGLASGVYTRDINKAMLIADALDAGTVFINTYNKTDVAAPFGGFKQSGFGKDLGEAALEEYTRLKTVTVEFQ